ncbi:MAG: ABC transporter permease subunit [Ruminococcaceae bacterium]|nr:ABC transporter permease subunit [Oscillospiraceae bacterium]
MTTSIIKNSLIRLLKIAIGIIFCLALWEIIALGVNNSYFMPRVKETLTALNALVRSDGFTEYVLTSLSRVAVGLLLGILFGIFFATICHVLPLSEVFVSPLITIMKTTPIATIILILWFTLSNAELAIFVVFLIVTPVVWQNVYDGYKSISQDMREVCEIFEISRMKRFRILIFPTVLKYLIPAIITSIGLAWKAEVAAEIMTYSNMGQSINDFKTLHYDTASVFAWAIVIITLSVILETIVKAILRRIKT